MPHIPVMGISPVLVIRIVETSTGRRRRTPIERIRIIFFYHTRKNLFKQTDIICAQIITLCLEIAPVMPCGLNLIVTAPQSKTRMMPDSSHIILCLTGNIFHKIIVHIIDITCKKQILPYNQSVAVAKIKKCIRWEETASPHTHTVEICTHTGF